jgi:ketosteroid isomerase-like protein
MSRENVEILRRLNAAFNRRDREAMFAAYHPDVEWCDLEHAPDAPERLRGIAAVRAYVEQWYDAFEDFTAKIEEYIDAGDFVVTVTQWRATGKGSGLAIDLHAADVTEFADGKAIRITITCARSAATDSCCGGLVVAISPWERFVRSFSATANGRETTSAHAGVRKRERRGSVPGPGGDRGMAWATAA